MSITTEEFRAMQNDPKARPQKKRLSVEHDAQVALMAWARFSRQKYPELELLFAIPNGGDRNLIVAQRMKAEGVKSGVSDLLLPVARGKYHGMFIELKAPKGGLSVEQQAFIHSVRKQGYHAVVCFGSQDTIDAITAYLNLP